MLSKNSLLTEYHFYKKCKGMNAKLMNVKHEKQRNLKSRTKSFALQIIHLYSYLPKTSDAQILGKQIVRSGTSVGAHYREASRARSIAEFLSKMQVGLQELEETLYWLELLADSEILNNKQISDLYQEAKELIAMLVSSIKTAKERNSKNVS